MDLGNLAIAFIILGGAAGIGCILCGMELIADKICDLYHWLVARRHKQYTPRYYYHCSKQTTTRDRYGR